MISHRATTRLRLDVLRCTKRFSSSADGSAGSTVAAGGGFSEKEKAAENQWARTHDNEKLKALHAELEKQKKVTDDIAKKVEALENKS
ncbi:hypothetical protein [Absidia glauca]|uniref:ATPase inhibitor, mitochondrial n=1 Tax=Absidia glauca TaxID=4829 RepID=A0A163LNX5_ABSGL|nr:hypothetical protein [Absidia glauca]